ncbi:MAG TPA: hydrogenase nickel incorporation protein HypB [Phycisphaerae bacterium]|nr:hydrogenase nickel incorporation protein HypB [Phycisphaerae bacterium]HOJ73789.1 hydrogenase nickel incorporation protein HypB [Phycisphaerae bacterium]HOM50436.1 hydrogenase nickel incorporation protein HypB [Phycisphaerae bacterium]HON65435.1 hydrogenase nickel incorporation protein HypB [Phycisphaerae bacterium]HOQ85708.1 hydrogenase nickel incorporation protein HypB [Phycisphaerae bacterium]
MKINVVENVLKANDAVAAANRRMLSDRRLLAVNLMSAPGSGKTTLLEKTIPALGEEYPCGVMVGDLQTTRDAERLGPYAVTTTQINTGTGCHLSATQVAEALPAFDLDRLAFLFIENVGNMVCPAQFDLGEHVKAILLSIPEGDDKVAKYPTLFQQADVVLLTKVDLLGILDYDLNRVRDDLARINTRAPFIQLSSKTGQGFDQWLAWLKQQRLEHTRA